MKFMLALSLLLAMTATQRKCRQSSTLQCLKGRLEVKGICSNYTIKLLEGDIDKSMIVANWTDETTGKKYKNVFALDNPCSFPSDINEGDEFYFTVITNRDKDCNVCMAYYPTPPKRLLIKASKLKCPE